MVDSVYCRECMLKIQCGECMLKIQCGEDSQDPLHGFSSNSPITSSEVADHIPQKSH